MKSAISNYEKLLVRGHSNSESKPASKYSHLDSVNIDP